MFTEILSTNTAPRITNTSLLERVYGNSLFDYVLDILGEYLSARLKVMQQNILEKKQALFTAATIICSCRNFNFIVWTIDRYVDDRSFSPSFKISWEIRARDFKKRLWKVKIF